MISHFLIFKLYHDATSYYNAIIYHIRFYLNAEIGFLRSSSMFSENVSFKDYGGGTIIHVTGGLFALVSCLILGPRVMRLKSIDVYGLTDG